MEEIFSPSECIGMLKAELTETQERLNEIEEYTDKLELNNGELEDKITTLESTFVGFSGDDPTMINQMKLELFLSNIESIDYDELEIFINKWS